VDAASLKARFDEEIRALDKDHLWEMLEDMGYVDDVHRGLSEWEEFEEQANKAARWQRRLLGRRKPPGRGTRLPQLLNADFGLTDLEAEHAAALAEYLAKRATLLPEVQGFREEKLGGGVLEDPEQVTTFLRSELKHLPPEEYEEVEFALEQIPSILGRNEWEELKDLVGGAAYRGREAERRYWHENHLRAVKFDSMSCSYEPPERYPYGIMHLIHDKNGQTLEDLGRRLIDRYPWPLRDAAWFVITGETPEVEVLNIGQDRAHGTYTLTFAPWISEKTIRRAYQGLQDEDNQPIRQKGLSAFCFVEDLTEPVQTPKWGELTKRWNRYHPDDKFWDRSALRRAYRRAEKRLASAWIDEPADAEEDIFEPDDPS
jgi:hypothetical protein